MIAGITLNDHTELVAIRNGSLTALHHLQNVLQPRVTLLLKIWNEISFCSDTFMVALYLNDHNIEVIEWPGNSLPFRTHAGDIGTKNIGMISGGDPKLSRSKPDCCVIRAKGGHTRY